MLSNVPILCLTSKKLHLFIWDGPGKGVAVVIDVSEYEAMQEKIELLEEIQKAEAQLSAGLGICNLDARSQVLKRIKN